MGNTLFFPVFVFLKCHNNARIPYSDLPPNLEQRRGMAGARGFVRKEGDGRGKVDEVSDGFPYFFKK